MTERFVVEGNMEDTDVEYREEEEEEPDFLDRDYEVPKKYKRGWSKARWSSEEDERLKRIAERFGTDDWQFIASFMPDRSDAQCGYRWQRFLNPSLVKGTWTQEEDQKVIALVSKYGPKRWAFIAKRIEGRIGKQCRERWHNHLNPTVKKSSWTQEEDRIIYNAQTELGNRWAEIAKLLPGRTDNAIKNHWNSTLKREVEQDDSLRNGRRHLCPDAKSKSDDTSPLAAPDSPGGEEQDVRTRSQRSGCSIKPKTSRRLKSIKATQDDPAKEQRIQALTSSEHHVADSRTTEYTRILVAAHPIDCGGGVAVTDFKDAAGSAESPPGGSGHRCKQTRHSSVHRTGGVGAKAATPIKYLAVAELSPLKHMPEFAETLQMIDSAMHDDSSWRESLMLEILTDGMVARECPALRDAGAGHCATMHHDGASASIVFPLHCLSSSSIGSASTSGIGSTDTSGEAAERLCLRDDAGHRSSHGESGKAVGRCGEGQVDPVESPAGASRLASQPAILRRGGATPHSTSDAVEGVSSLSFSALDLSRTPPKSNHLHILPFSPSQFLNTAEREKLQMETPSFTSTPVSRQRLMVRTPLQREHTPGQTKENGFRTPNIRCSPMETTPRTPTPFKNALAAQEVKYGPLKGLPRTPSHLEEDLRDVLRTVSASSHDGFTGDSERSPSPTISPRLEARVMLGSPAKKARKSLVLDVWSSDNLNTKLFPCEPSVSPGGSPARELLTSSLLTRPVTGRAEDSLVGHEQTPYVAKPLPSSSVHGGRMPGKVRGQMNSDWEVVTFGRTEDQLLLTEQARKYMKLLGTRTLKL